MKVLIVSAADVGGGAFIAARRLHFALLKNGVDSRMLVAKKTLDEKTIIGPTSNVSQTWADVRHYLSLPFHRLHKTDNPNLHSFAVVPSRLHEVINAMDVDIVNLHWINREMMSIADIGKINKPVVWTLHDMWPLLGTAHYEKFVDDNAVKADQRGWVNLDEWMYGRKARHWSHSNLSFIAPSQWMGRNVRNSRLFSRVMVENIANTLDMSVYQPCPRKVVCELLGLNPDKRHILFGAMTGAGDIRKGFTYLRQALGHLSPEQYPDIELLVLGGGSGTAVSMGDMPFPVRVLGRLHDDVSLKMVYNAADVYVTPSLADNLPNTVVESLACGTPVVAFSDVGGMGDMVEHKVNGYLATLRDSIDLARGIEWTLEHSGNEMSRQEIRRCAEARFAEGVIAARHIAFYQSLITAQTGH